MYREVYGKIGENGRVPIRIYRVSDKHHIDRIDDRILSQIQKAPVVIVDLTEENFNVAFEAGYALSQGKPIVWTKQHSEGKLELPFDIQSHNILLYNPEKLTEFNENLEFRILAALSKAKEKSRWRNVHNTA
jgi:nucleoside 2-deoxyribosyltransferase